MKFSLFLLEQILALLVFAITAALCVQLFVSSHLISKANIELNYALLAAQNSAEAYKAADGDWQLTADLLEQQTGINPGVSTICVGYDSQWQPCPAADAVYTMSLRPLQTDIAGIKKAQISIIKTLAPTETPIYTLQVTAREVRR